MSRFVPMATLPYIGSWDRELINTPAIVQDGSGIAFRDEREEHRDPEGVLWASRSSHWGHGAPQPGIVHPQRQRHAMRDRLCQSCAEPADRNEAGTLWLVPEPAAEPDGRMEGVLTQHPPVCMPCARRVAGSGPRRACVALRVATPVIWGVYGYRYRPGMRTPLRGEAVAVPYGGDESRWVLAVRQVALLTGCTLTDLTAGPVGKGSAI